jgi:hypothetical protein
MESVGSPSSVFYAYRTAIRYVAVAEWARTRPREFARVADLSITKIYRLLRIDPELRRRLVGRRHLVPSTNRRQPLAEMTIVQLDEVIDSFTTGPPPDDPLPHLVQATRNRFANLQANVDELLAHEDRVDPDVLVEFHTAAVELTDRLATALPRRRR